jgi:G3E family GTPase
MRDPDKIKVLALVGFLGAGKTTLLRQMLAAGADLSDTVVVVNEFGEVGIDGSLLQDEGSDVIELTNGCVCCTLLVDLTLTLQSILERFTPRKIIIEASGVADPRGIAAALRRPGIAEHMALHKTVAVLDADVWEMRHLFGQLFSLQLQMADLILLNKIDLVGKEKAHAFLADLREEIPLAQVVPTSYCRIDPESIWTEGDQDDAFQQTLDRLHETYTDPGNGQKRLDSERDLRHDHAAEAGAAGFVTFSFQSAGPLEEQRFQGFMEQLPFEVFRAKGTVRFRDRTMLLNYVGGRAEWAPWNGDAETRLAFVGWDVDGDGIIRKLRECVGRGVGFPL